MTRLYRLWGVFTLSTQMSYEKEDTNTQYYTQPQDKAFSHFHGINSKDFLDRS